MTETEQFICNIKRYCNKKGFNASGFLAVRLFETGGALSAWLYSDIKQSVDYVENGERLSAFGLLQFTPIGCEPLQEKLGVPKAQIRSNHIAAWRKVTQMNRAKQLDLLFAYFDFWDPITTKLSPNVKRDSILYQYLLTLSPGGGENYKDGSGYSAKQLVNKDSFRAYLVQAEGMLNGTIGVPNDEDKVQVIREGAQAAAYLKRLGTSIVNPNTCDIASAITSESASVPATSTEPTKGTRSLEDRLPLSMSFSIPEYPRLIGLKPGDVLILPSSATYRDWVITSVSREFNQGLNKLTIQANRPLEAKAFVQVALLKPEFKTNEEVNKYYWLSTFSS
jgi:hypothetical protein